MATLTRLIKVMYPQDRFPDGPFERCAEVVRDGVQTDLPAGLARLDDLAGGSFKDADDAALRQLVDGLGRDDFVVAVHSVAVNTLYNDHEVWTILGYEGPSFEKGGYINRGFDDLDWLPEARITEYEGQGRVENVPLAQNAGGN
ncbi:hypothetical protein EAX62_12275 [Tessaracoccus antarcticus]|uniref:Gluconate 2-dehydrogenase subunit 3 family protein n=2 Tax=Tessaracoccus antarcticus TaxID=2479848 RepID=A0A3M0G256_9ACTN|nr:hypothetical protein EAX62_12275 [Tessaracoccus antarcticus]